MNTYTINDQEESRICCDGSGNFVVTWSSYAQDGSMYGIFAQRYDSSGQPRGQEFQVNAYTTQDQGNQSDVCCAAGGSFVVAWHDSYRDGDSYGIFARRFGSSGQPVSGDFIVNAYTTSTQRDPAISCDAAGDFTVAWSSYGQDGDGEGIFARSFNSAGQPLAGEIHVNSFTPNNQSVPDVCSDGAGNFTVAWGSQDEDGSDTGVFARSFGRTGQALTPEFLVNTYTGQSQSEPGIACDAAGNFVVAWTSSRQDGQDGGIFAQLFNSLGAAGTAPVPVASAAGLVLLVGALAGGGVRLLSRRRRRG